MEWLNYLVPGGIVVCALSCLWILVHLAVRR